MTTSKTETEHPYPIMKRQVGFKKNGKPHNRSCYVSNCKKCGKEIYIIVKDYRKHGWTKRCKSCYTKENIKKLIENNRFSVNDNYFSEKSLQSVYWGGVLAADGNIKRDRNLIRLTVKKSDLSILERLVKDLDSDANISNSKNEKHPSSTVAITSKQIVKDLLEIYNITPCKSLTLQPPNLTNEEEVRAFIVGYIDGDGTIGYHVCGRYANTTYWRYSLSLLGTYEMCRWIKSWIDYWIPSMIQYKGIYKPKNKNFYILSFNGKRAEKTLNLLNTSPVEKLERKWDKFLMTD